MKLRFPTSLLALAVCSFTAQANVTLAPLFRDGAVLQQGKSVPVWGQADPGEKITVEFQGQKKEVTAGADGKWRINLDPLSVSATPTELIATGKNTVKVSDVLVGEVWICSGQSNMAWYVKNAKDFDQEAAAANLPLIRHFKVELKPSEKPEDTLNGEWATCSPQTVGDFSATGYFFGRELYKTLNVPIGLINTSYGGTPVESWMSDAALKENPAFASVFARWKQTLSDYPNQLKIYEQRAEKWKADREAAQKAGQPFATRPPRKPDGPGSRMSPSSLFNAMVHPLIPYGIRGVIWYQGEANAARFTEYGALFQGMITQWRRDFAQDNVPFYFVQLANLERKADPSSEQWAFQREAQASALKLPHTGMAVAVDIGEAGNIHPKNKQEVGRRLALIALALTYEKGGEYAGPVFKSAQADGSAMKVSFDHARGLKVLDTPGTYELAGADRKFYPASARVVGEELVVTSPSVTQPTAVRYGWKNNPSINLYNEAGLPAPPFRSDDWEAPADALPAAVAPEAGEGN